MLQSLLNFFHSMNHTTKKEDVLTNIKRTFDNLNNEVLPTLSNVIENVGNSDVIKKNNNIKLLAISAGIKSKDNKDTLVKLKAILTNIAKNDDLVEKLVNDKLPDVVTDKTVTVRDLAILKLASDLSNLTLFTLDFLYMILTDPKDSDFPKIKFQLIKDGMSDYGILIKTYSDKFTKKIETIGKIADLPLETDEHKSSFFEKLLGKEGKVTNLPNVNNFVGNPIYHIRLWLVDREVKKYENLKDKKKLLELKVLELKAKEANEGENPKLKKQIEYYEDKISSVEYEIAKIENN